MIVWVGYCKVLKAFIYFWQKDFCFLFNLVYVSSHFFSISSKNWKPRSRIWNVTKMLQLRRKVGCSVKNDTAFTFSTWFDQIDRKWDESGAFIDVTNVNVPGLRIIGGWGEDKSSLQLIGEDNRWGQLAPQAGHKVIDVTTWSLGQLPDNRLKLYQSFLYCCQCFFFCLNTQQESPHTDRVSENPSF